MHLKLTRFEIILPVFLGIISFFLVAGPFVLNPINIHWLQGGFDPSQHYIGWSFFRHSPWSIPLGLNPNYGMEYSNAIVFSDSIPLLAFLFKPFSAILPEPFQYFGIWLFACFILQALFAWKLIGLISSNRPIIFFGSILFLFSPPMMYRVGIHAALVGHFLILAGLYLNLKPELARNFIFWVSLVLAAALIHFYLFIIVLSLFLANLLDRTFIKNTLSKISAITEVITITFLIGAVMWLAGYFSMDMGNAQATGTWGYGVFRFNLLSPFDARGYSYLLKPLPIPMDYGDGFQFLGLGVLVILIAVLISYPIKRPIFWAKIPQYPFLFLCLITLTLLSFSNIVGIGPNNYVVNLPTDVIKILSVLRGSGRMFWPAFYAIIFILIYLLIQSCSKKISICILIFAAFLQVVDTSAGWLETRARLMKNPASSFDPILVNPFWGIVGSHYSKLLRVPANSFLWQWDAFANYANQYSMVTNSVSLGRVDDSKVQLANQNLEKVMRSGKFDPMALYVIENWQAYPVPVKFNPAEDLFAMVDNFRVLAPGWKICKTCPQFDSVIEITQFVPEIKIGELIDFSFTGSQKKYDFTKMGWGFSESWGIWSTDEVAELIFPHPSIGQVKKITIQARALVNDKHPEQFIEIWLNGVFQKKITLKDFGNNQFDIEIPKEQQGAQTLTIQFKFPGITTPKSIGMGDDDRKLALGLKSVQFF